MSEAGASAEIPTRSEVYLSCSEWNGGGTPTWICAPGERQYTLDTENRRLMAFFDPQGNQLSYQQWLTVWEPAYFLGGPTYGSFSSGYQSSRVVENQVDALLTQKFPLSLDDLVLAMAWKIGDPIDRQGSQVAGSIRYKGNWPATLITRGYYGTWDFSQSIPWLAANMAVIRQQLLGANPQYLFNLRLQGRGFGKVHKLAVQFFVTNGADPIYDKYAHLGALAIDQNLPPGSTVRNYRPVQTWQHYQAFRQLLKSIGLQPQETMFISRADDRALWVYGHFFSRCDTAKMRKAARSAVQRPPTGPAGTMTFAIY